MIKAVIFDFFGVIYPDLSSKWLSEEVGDIDKFKDDYKEICRKNDLGQLNNGIFYDELSKITNIPSDDIRAGIRKQMKLNNALVEYIESLKPKYKLIILSNCGGGFLPNILKQEDIGILFDDVIVSSEVGLIKPDPKIFELVLTKLGIESDEAIFVDDNQSNIDGANKLGIKSLLFTDTQKFINDMNELL